MQWIESAVMQQLRLDVRDLYVLAALGSSHLARPTWLAPLGPLGAILCGALHQVEPVRQKGELLGEPLADLRREGGLDDQRIQLLHDIVRHGSG